MGNSEDWSEMDPGRPINLTRICWDAGSSRYRTLEGGLVSPDPVGAPFGFTHADGMVGVKYDKVADGHIMPKPILQYLEENPEVREHANAFTTRDYQNCVTVQFYKIRGD